MDSMIIQVWSCNTCDHERQYGHAPKPTEAHQSAWLYCSNCKSTVEHEFVRIQEKGAAQQQGVETDTVIPRIHRY
jgi:hypothetical protein